jgi:trans-aconitate 2-methyltransferase
MREWNAETYHRVSDPQLRWGLAVLNRLRLAGDELVVDVGCGTGRLTEHLARRLPRGRVVAVDISANMLATAQQHLESLASAGGADKARPAGRGRIVFAQADAAALPFNGSASAVFSTATFHWVLDHDALFASIFTTLAPGGRLLAQCGGGPNLSRLVERASRLRANDPFAPYFAGWTQPWEFADAATTARRLAAAGFTAVDTSEQYAPVTFPTADAFREFAVNVVCRPYLAQLPDAILRDSFMDLLVEEYARDSPAFELDYWRLNLAGRRPS